MIFSINLSLSVSKDSTSWFHCGRCGALFHAPIGTEVARVCPSCGSDPSLGIMPLASKKIPGLEQEPEVHHEEWHTPHERHRRRQRKPGMSLGLLVLGWCLVMGLIILVARQQWKVNEMRSDEWSRPTGNQLTSDQYDFLREHASACQLVIGNVLSFSTPEHVSQHVFNARMAFSDMVRFHRTNPGTQMLEVPMLTDGFTVLQLPGELAIEGRWLAEDGRLVDAVFRMEEGEWRLDWHHFARYSDYPWALFLAGDGPEQAEFRLLVRQRLARTTILDTDSLPLSVVFHAPRFGYPNDPGPPSPAFDLDWDSDAARVLVAGFDQSRQGRQPFQSILPSVEKDDEMMRVRLVVKRIEEDGVRRFEIVEVLACHWLQHDDPGVSLEAGDVTGREVGVEERESD